MDSVYNVPYLNPGVYRVDPAAMIRQARVTTNCAVDSVALRDLPIRDMLSAAMGRLVRLIYWPNPTPEGVLCFTGSPC